MSDKAKRERRRIGRNGPEVLAVGLGCMSLSGTYGTSDDAAAIPPCPAVVFSSRCRLPMPDNVLRRPLRPHVCTFFLPHFRPD